MTKQFKELTDVLDYGTHVIKVYPKQEYSKETNSYIPNSHKQGVSKKGNKWYMYNTKIGEDNISIFANNQNKHLFDSGEVTVAIVKRFNPNTGEPSKKFYINDPKRSSSEAVNHSEVKKRLEPVIEEEEPISIDSVPF